MTDPNTYPSIIIYAYKYTKHISGSGTVKETGRGGKEDNDTEWIILIYIASV
jgi:hypothetical protein